LVSIKDVAKRAGVSISTVSNVVNQTKFVSEELTKRVHIAVQELNYHPDPVAKSMKSRHSRNIGVIATDICGLFYPYVIKGLFEVFNKNGYNMIIIDSNGLNDQFGSVERVMDGFTQLIRSRVDGIVFSSIFPESIEQIQMKKILRMTDDQKKVALVSVETDFSKYGIDSVHTNSVKGAEKATRHLLDVGCRRIGHITGPVFTRVAQDRIMGFRNAMSAAGFPVDDRMIANGDYTHRSGYGAMRELLGQMPDIDGVFIANDQMSVGALRAISEAGRRVPDDIKVIGYDDVFVASVLETPLSTIHIRKRHMGIEAARLLLTRIQKQNEVMAPRLIELDSRLMVRKSTSANAPEDWIMVDW
jgi:DNA-binding LacI/PurR family transcriptional regulator